MSASLFTTQLYLQADDDGLPWTLYQPLGYISEHLNRRLEVPAGFPTDLASIPRAFQWLFPPTGGYARAAVIHDYLYVTNGMDRGDADAVLKEAMDVCGVGRFTRWNIYLAVRAGGWVSWKRYREADEARSLEMPLTGYPDVSQEPKS